MAHTQHTIWRECMERIPVHRAVNQPIFTAKQFKQVPQLDDHDISQHLVRCRVHSKSNSCTYRPEHRCGRNGYYHHCFWEGRKPHLKQSEIHWKPVVSNDVWNTNKWCSYKASRQCPVKTHLPRTYLHRDSNSRDLAEREYDLQFWREQLAAENDAMRLESCKLKSQLHDMLVTDSESHYPLGAAENCMECDVRRQISHPMDDECQDLLCKEKKLIETCQETMNDMKRDANEQLRRNCEISKAFRYNVDNINQSWLVDNVTRHLRYESTRNGFHPGIACENSPVTSPENWLRFTKEHVRHCREEREKSRDLRHKIEYVTRSTANEIWHQGNVTRNALTSRTQKTLGDRNRAQTSLDALHAEIKDLERATNLMRQAIVEREGSLHIAAVHVDEAVRQMTPKSCNDRKMLGLQQKVSTHCGGLEYMRCRHQQLERTLCQLKNQRDQLQYEVDARDYDMGIENAGCLTCRDGFSMDTKGGPILHMPLVKPGRCF